MLPFISKLLGVFRYIWMHPTAVIPIWFAAVKESQPLKTIPEIAFLQASSRTSLFASYPARIKLLSGISTEGKRMKRYSMSSSFLSVGLPGPGLCSFGFVSLGRTDCFGVPFLFGLMHPNKYPAFERIKKSPSKSRGLLPIALSAIGIAKLLTFLA